MHEMSHGDVRVLIWRLPQANVGAASLPRILTGPRTFHQAVLTIGFNRIILIHVIHMPWCIR